MVSCFKFQLSSSYNNRVTWWGGGISWGARAPENNGICFSGLGDIMGKN